mgnify:CR=1 FL=1
MKQQSPEQMLKILKTKAWVWTCAHELADRSNCTFRCNKTGISYNIPPKPVKAFTLANKANDYHPKSKLYDQAGFYRYMKGQQAANEATVRNLWEDYRDVYLVGPIANQGTYWENHNLQFNVPLWSAISGDIEKLVKQWGRINPMCLNSVLANAENELCSTGQYIYNNGINNASMLDLATNIILDNDNKICPLIIFASYLAKLRLNNDNKFDFYNDIPCITIYEPNIFFDYYIHSLAFLKISTGEIENVLSNYSLTIGDNFTNCSWFQPDPDDDYEQIAVP